MTNFYSISCFGKSKLNHICLNGPQTISLRHCLCIQGVLDSVSTRTIVLRKVHSNENSLYLTNHCFYHEIDTMSTLINIIWLALSAFFIPDPIEKRTDRLSIILLLSIADILLIMIINFFQLRSSESERQKVC